MVNWGPVTGSVGPGTVTPDGRRIIIFDTGVVPVGSTTHWTGSCSTTFVGGRNDAVWDVDMVALDANGATIERVKKVQQRLSAPTGTWTYDAPVTATRIRVEPGAALYAGQTITFTANGTYETRAPCEYGTQLKDAGTFIYYLTPALIDTICIEAGMAWIAPFFTALYFTTFDAHALCGKGPPPMPVLNFETISGSLETITSLFQVIAWPHFCQCISGAPAPVPYPPPVVVQPPGVQAPPTFPCDNVDPCAALRQIQQQLLAISQTLHANYELVTLTQRYGFPFAYIRGAIHSNLTGDGGFAISRLLGLQVEVTARPPDRPVLQGNPPYVTDLGWLTILTADGTLEERRLSRDSFIWIPKGCQQAVRFQWSLFPNVTVRVTELEAEP